MGFRDYLSKVISTDFFGFTQSVGTVDDEQRAIFPDWLYSARLGQPRNVNIPELRMLAKSAWVQMIENTLRKEVMTVPTNIVNVDDEDENEYVEEKKLLQDYLDKVNEDGQNIVDVCVESISDVAEIDSAVWNNVYTLDSYELKDDTIVDGYGNDTQQTTERMVLKPFGQRRLAETRAVNGGSFLKNVDVYKRLLGYYQYSYRFPRYKPMVFDPDEIVYLIMNKRSDSVYGFSPLQSVQQVVRLMINSIRWNDDFFKSNMIPDGIVSLPGADADSIKRFKAEWKNKVRGKPHELLFQNTNAAFTPLITNPRDLEFLEGQKWYFHLVFAVYGMSPVEVGFHENVNRSTQEGQERVTVKNAIKPYFKLFEDAVHQRITTEVLQNENPPIKWVFKPKDHSAESIEHNQCMAELDRDALTINEYRKTKGRAAVEWGDGPQEPEEPEEDSDDGNNQPKPKDENKDKLLQRMLDAGDDIVYEAKDYSDFMEKTVDKMQQSVVNSLQYVEIKTEKTFGQFLASMMNVVNTKVFMKQLRKMIKKSLIEGMEDTEKELNVDIGWSEGYENKLASLEGEQLNGYTINGKMWFGIKGATKQLQNKILKEVEEAVRNKVSRDVLTKSINDLFEGSTMSQARRIARTETTRFVNEGKLMGYKESGIKGRKAWASVNDENTSDIDRRLHKKYFGKGIPFDDAFIDDKTGKSFMSPPSHPNCRCVIEYRTVKTND